LINNTEKEIKRFQRNWLFIKVLKT
jgi:hypothetical protein